MNNYVIVKVAIGGFSMGAAIALYSATCFAIGRYGNDIPYPVNLRTVVGLSGWLPGSRYALKLFLSLISQFPNNSTTLHTLIHILLLGP